MRPDDHRRKWDKDEFERIAADRLKAEIEEEERAKKKGMFTDKHYIINTISLNLTFVKKKSSIIQ